MEFNQLISEKLHSLFTECGLEITEQLKNIVRYESTILHISLVHDDRENSNTLWIGRKYFDTIEIDNYVLREYFSSGLKLNNLPQESFVNNVFLFFLGDGEKLLKGIEADLVSFEKFGEKRSSQYTENLINKRSLEAAEKAWKEGNYSDVIRYLKAVNEDDLPKPFKQKYKIAKKRASN